MPPYNRKNGIPDRWLDYQALGKRLPGSRFIAFKVPLKQSLTCRLPCPEVFGPWELLEALGKENQELGLLMDLTFTTRYYRLEDIPDSLLWIKIPTAGHEVPSDATILSFKRAVRRFLRDNANNDKLVGVHCTHGLNRTGYLVCRYLIDVDGMDPAKAVELFNSSRGHTIERGNYLEDLQSGPKRSNEGMDVSEQEPMRGCAAHRPSSVPFGSDPREERRSHSNDRYYHGPSQRGRDHQSHHWLPHGGHHPARPFPPNPPMGPPLPSYRWSPPRPSYRCSPPRPSYRCSPPQPSYRWSPPRPDAERRRPLHPQETRHRYPPREPEWSSPYHPGEERRSGRHPSASPYPVLPRYSARTCCSDEPNGHKAPEEWAGPRTKPHHRHTHKQRVSAYRDDF